MPNYQQQQQQPNEPTTAELTDTKIDQFVEAMVEVQAIREEVSAELEATQDAEEAQEVQRDAQAKMIEAVENAGLTVHEYNRIAALMGQDPELRQRIDAKVAERS
jgi:hypothetical protein